MKAGDLSREAGAIVVMTVAMTLVLGGVVMIVAAFVLGQDVVVWP